MFSEELEKINWEETTARIASKTETDVIHALSKEHLSIDDFMALISPAAVPYLEQMARLSMKYTQERFGKTISMYIPLYLSNACTNFCVYCGFNHNNDFARTTLNDEQIEAECKAIRALGPFENLLIVTGEAPTIAGVDYLENALKIAVLLRAGLKSRTPKDSKKPWDARLSLGVGTISYHADNIVLSDGEAFQYSGRELDEMGKRRLIVKTRWSDVNEELQVSTAFADEVISSWSVSQSQAVYQALLYNISQKDIAHKFQKSAQNISKLLNAAKMNLVQMYINRYHNLISNLIR